MNPYEICRKSTNLPFIIRDLKKRLKYKFKPLIYYRFLIKSTCIGIEHNSTFLKKKKKIHNFFKSHLQRTKYTLNNRGNILIDYIKIKSV